MLDLEALREALDGFATPGMLLFMSLGVLSGILLSAVPGKTTSTILALLLPFTFPMSFEEAVTFLSAAYAGCAYGGAIPAVLLNVPGTPGSAATAIEGYQMTRRGRAGEALGYVTAASFVGGLFGYVVLLFLMRPLADFALMFGPAERLALGILTVCVIGSLSSGAVLKGLLGGFTGLLVGTVGFSTTGFLRGTMGFPELIDGVNIVPVVIGLFAIPAAIAMSRRTSIVNRTVARVGPRSFFVGFRDTFRHGRLLGASSVLGLIVGILPAIGDTVAAFLNYDLARKISRHPERFGKGNPEGVIATETPDKAGVGGGLATTLALGIPGSGACAIILSAMTAQGVTAGPQLFLDVGGGLGPLYAIILALILSQFALVLFGTAVSLGAARVVLAPNWFLVPMILVMCVVGSYVVNQRFFDVALMFVFGLVGLVMRATGFSVVPFVLGVVMGSIVDEALAQTYLTYGGDMTVVFTRPLSLVLLVIAALLIFAPKLVTPKGQRSSSHSM
jgi:putative tricarboxylic transport membrane protein